ncbi:MAG: hypothetical protein ACTHXA_08495 [Gulosibacter sp.]|uniref:hypothetical protein n=1 Tax=Gulosibacter sp. TaxID=2817531 RepID=UPI003F93BBAB
MSTPTYGAMPPQQPQYSAPGYGQSVPPRPPSQGMRGGTFAGIIAVAAVIGIVGGLLFGWLVLGVKRNSTRAPMRI